MYVKVKLSFKKAPCNKISNFLFNHNFDCIISIEHIHEEKIVF